MTPPSALLAEEGAAAVGVTFVFTVTSPRYGSFTVTAPERFRPQIEALTWGVTRNRTRAAGRDFVVTTAIQKGKTLHLHRLIWRLMGRPDCPRVDHIDGQPLNNAEDNLRAATHSQNQANRRNLNRNNRPGITGVGWCKRLNRWLAQICVNGKSTYVGVFRNIEDARRARDAAAAKVFGDFAVPSAEQVKAPTKQEFAPAPRGVHKSHCPHGHEYAGDNLIIRGGRRYCRQCQRNRDLSRRRPPASGSMVSA